MELCNSASSDRNLSNATTHIDEQPEKTEVVVQHLDISTPSTTPIPPIPTRSLSRPHLVRPRSPSQRRGLFPSLSIIPEVENPYHYSKTTKWLITVIMALAAVVGPTGATIILPALPRLNKDFHTTSDVTNLSVAMYMLGMAISPLWWSFFSSIIGRRTIYLISFFLFVLLNIASALSTSITMFITMRVFAGGAAASVQAVGAGTLADIWGSKELGRAIGIFFLGPIFGTLLATIGGALSEAFGWRSTQWFQVIYGSVLFVILTLFLPETLAIAKNSSSPLEKTNTTRNQHKSSSKAKSILKTYIFHPLRVLCYAKFPAILIIAYLGSLTFGCLYALNISIQKTFSDPPHNFSPKILGLLYLPTSLGFILAAVFGGRWADRILDREAKKSGRCDADGNLLLLPENRLRENIWIAAVLFPAALLCYGWTASEGVHWIVPIIATFFFGLGSMVVMCCAMTMLTEFLPGHSSEGAAVQNFGRNLFSCICSVVAGPVIDGIGDGWLFTILAILCWISSVSVFWAMKRFGPKWRIEMDRKFKAQ